MTLAIRHNTKANWVNKDLPLEISGSNILTDIDFGKLLKNTKNSYGISFWFEVFIFLLCPIPYYDLIIPF
jgi:hypothetical protein